MLKLLKAANNQRGRIENKFLERATFHPEKAQREFLLRLVSRNARTVFGRAHDFGRIKTAPDFRNQVPVRDYEAFRPFVNRITNGESAVLTAEKPFLLTMTSGTTGEPKLIPVTRQSQALNANLMRQWLFRAEQDHKNLTAEASVGVVSRAIEGFTASGLPYGSASGLIYKNIPFPVRRAYAVPALVSEIEDYEERYFVLARFALAVRVSFVATPNAATLLRLAEVCVQNQEKLIRAIYDGSLGLNEPQQPEICRELAAKLKPNPARAKFLTETIERRGFLRLADCWSDLKLVGCWVGGSAGAQIAKLSAHFGATPIRDLGYLSSEAHVSLPIRDETSAGILALHNNFYEFIPEAEIEAENPATLFAHELEIGKRYGILLTTAGGLYRYQINDIVEVTGFYNQTPLVAFVRKSGEAANITGEKMYAAHIVAAVNAASRKFNLEVRQFRAAPNFAKNRYEIYLELENDFSRERLRSEVLPEIDFALGRANCEYEQKRQSKRLAAPAINLMKRGWAAAEFKRHIETGKRDTQFKWQILSPAPSDADERLTAEIITADIIPAPVKMF